VIELQPDNLNARNHLAIVHLRAGRTDDAIAEWQAAMKIRDDDLAIIDNLAGALAQTGRLVEATELAQRAIRLAPNRPESYSTLGNLHVMRVQYDEALAAYGKAVALAPDFADAWANMGVALQRAVRLDEAIQACRRALDANPSHAGALRTLGMIAYLMQRYDDAVAHWTKAVELNPNDADALSDLAGAYVGRSELALSLETYRRSLALRPNHAETRSRYLVTLHADPTQSPRQIAAEHFRFGELHDSRLPPPAFANSRDPERVIRVGYLAPYFYRHAVATFIRGIFRCHNHERFRIVGYSDTYMPDDWTAYVRAQADEWHDVAHLTDAELAEKIRGDGVDILVDLSGHLAKNRLFTFAQRAAPIQVTYIAYQNTTGLRSMDYRITDRIADPVGKTDELHTEKLLRLPCFFVYEPPQDVDPVSPLPALSRGHVTFGSLNNPGKLNPMIIKLWSQILHRLPTARLTLLVNSRGVAEQVLLGEFAQHSIAADRLNLILRSPQANYFKLYHEIDLALDPHPFSGHTTTCDAIWMGVPVVTLAGEIYASRMTASVLANLPMAELITTSPRDYVEKVVSVASDLDALAAMRSALRERMRTSIITDAARFTASLEDGYREIWRKWCAEAE
jgi:predicted O-linked N-acetylglucosamine transferase (SPINDLY family)